MAGSESPKGEAGETGVGGLEVATVEVLNRLFSAINTGGDGHVTRNDIMRLERALGTTKITQDAAEKGLRELDEDGNSTVEKDEFLNYMAPRVKAFPMPESMVRTELERLTALALADAGADDDMDTGHSEDAPPAPTDPLRAPVLFHPGLKPSTPDTDTSK